MKKILAILILFFCDCQSFAQDNKTAGLQQIDNFLQLQYESGMTYILSYFDNFEGRNAPQNSMSVIPIVGRYLDEKKTTPEWEIINNNWFNIVRFLNNFTLLGNSPAKFFVNNQHKCIDICRKDTDRMFIISRVYCNDLFNTLQMKSKERAEHVLTGSILPSIHYFEPLFESNDFGYYGISVTYGSRDFLNDDEKSDLKPEILTAIFPSVACKKFINSKITDDEFISSCEFYLTDRDSQHTYRKVNLTSK